MPDTYNPDPNANQQTDAAKFVEKLRRIIALLGSDQQGERDNAFRLAARMLGKCGLRWENLVDGLSSAHDLEVARSAAQVLLEENESLRRELESRSTSAAFERVSPSSSHSRNAQWLLDMHAQGLVQLNAKFGACTMKISGSMASGRCGASCFGRGSRSPAAVARLMRTMGLQGGAYL